MNPKSLFDRSGVNGLMQSRRRKTVPGTLRGLCSLVIVVALLGSYISVAPLPVRADTELTVCANGCGYTDIQLAVDAASDGDVIKIATGVYTIGLSSQVVVITKTLTLRGGYNADFSLWNPDTYPTTLDALSMGRVVYVSGAITATLDGLHMLNGFANVGGGIFVDGSNLRLLNSLLDGSHINASYSYGAGLYQSAGSLYMENSTIQNSQGQTAGRGWGGGIYASSATVEIHDSAILSNTAAFSGWLGDGNGGGIQLDNSSTILQGVTFRNNTATAGPYGKGGGLSSYSGTLTINNCIFDSNVGSASSDPNASAAGGGAFLGTRNAIVSGNVFTGNITSPTAALSGSGGGLYFDTSGTSGSYGGIVGVLVSGNLFQNNTASSGGGISAQGALTLTIENNTFIGNHNSALIISARGDLGGATTGATVKGNLFQNNTTNNNGGGISISGPVNLLFNRFIGNHANNVGGGVYQVMGGDCWSGSPCDNATATYDGNLLIGNSAIDGGGLFLNPYSIHGGDLNIIYRNMALRRNTATNRGSAIYFYRYTNLWVNFKHLTITDNTGGEGSMFYMLGGRVSLANSILANGAIGIRDGGWLTLTNVLRYNVVTPTLVVAGIISDITPLTGNPAFKADGYHIGSLSAALDAGIDTGVIDDIDNAPRPLGSAPDIGADESPYSSLQNGVQASLLASAPVWKAYYTGEGVPPSTYLEQVYLIPFAYYAPTLAPPVTSYMIEDTFPTALNLSETNNPSDLTYSHVANTLKWTSTTTLNAGDWSWVGMIGRSDTATGGQHITTNGEMTWTLSNSSSYSLSFNSTITVPTRPIFAPILIAPLDGEMCLEAGNQLIAKGVAGAGMVIKLYEDNVLKGTTTAVISTGAFTLTWTSGLTTTHNIVLYTVACEPGNESNCSSPSRYVHLSYPQADWCPQRSYWEGDAYGVHHIFYFRDDNGRYATQDFVLPGVYGFSNTQLHLYSCCQGSDTNPFKVTADGVIYNSPTKNGRMYTFQIGMAHAVTIESTCPAIGGAPPPLTRYTYGVVLIDPDGFIFNVNQGGGYDAITGMYVPVQALANMTITAFVYLPEWGEWIRWPANLYGQINPQVTGASGYFAFFTPPGQYYLQVDAGNGYQSWRSPVVNVVNELVHVNIPLTPQSTGPLSRVTLTPEGPSPAVIIVPVGGIVEWNATPPEGMSVAEFQLLNANPVAQPRTGELLDPLLNIKGFDGGRLTPGQVYRRQFWAAGDYPYSDGLGNTGVVQVRGETFIYVPLVKK
jgi:predicted outer membrane repeat protein